DDAIALFLQDSRGEYANGVLVLNEQNRFGAACVLFWNDLVLAGLERRRRADFRKIELQRRAVSGLTVDPHIAARLLDDSIDRGEAEACAFSSFLGREERIERVLSGVAVHANAGVADCEHDVPAGDDGRVLAGIGLVELHVLRLDADRSTL